MAGDELTVSQVQKIYAEVSQTNSGATFHLLARIMYEWLIPEMGSMLNWFKEVGFGVSIEDCRKIHPGLMNFETWAKKSLA